MPKHAYRIFMNDRGRREGIPLYSAFSDVVVRTKSAPAAIRAADVGAFGESPFEPPVAILWPPETDEAKKRLAKHVDKFFQSAMEPKER